MRVVVGAAVVIGGAVPLVLASLPGGDHGAVATAVAAPVREPCPAGTVQVHVGVPSVGDVAARETATVRVIAGAGALCVLGERTAVVPPGSTLDVRVHASSAELQRIQVGTQVSLLRLPPGRTVVLKEDPTSGWRIEAPWLDPWNATASDALCARDPSRAGALPCRDGFSPTSGPDADPLCRGATTRARCVRSALVRLVRRGSGNFPTDRPLALCRLPPPGSALALRNLRRWCEVHTTIDHCADGAACPGLEVDTGHGRARLLVGYGERWTVTFDDTGDVDGVAEPARAPSPGS